jgi:hypothetical protein
MSLTQKIQIGMLFATILIALASIVSTCETRELVNYQIALMDFQINEDISLNVHIPYISAYSPSEEYIYVDDISYKMGGEGSHPFLFSLINKGYKPITVRNIFYATDCVIEEPIEGLDNSSNLVTAIWSGSQVLNHGEYLNFTSDLYPELANFNSPCQIKFSAIGDFEEVDKIIFLQTVYQ